MGSDGNRIDGISKSLGVGDGGGGLSVVGGLRHDSCVVLVMLYESEG